MDIQQLKDILETLSYITSVLGIPGAIYIFVKEKKKEREEREYGTYDALNQKYLEFTELCLNYPKLDVFDTPQKKKKRLSDEEINQEKQLFKILLSIFCRAYLMYKDHKKQMKENQWSGWEDYIMMYKDRKNFRQAWNELGHTFDKRFVDYMNVVFIGG